MKNSSGLGHNRLFSIAFSNEPISDLEPGETAIVLVMTLGSFIERTIADVSYWGKSQYEMQWIGAIRSVLSQTGKSALITSMRDPAVAKFIEWWPMWREGQEVILHHQLFFLDKLDMPFDPYHSDKFVGKRFSRNEDGEEISEWRVPVNAIQDFFAA